MNVNFKQKTGIKFSKKRIVTSLLLSYSSHIIAANHNNDVEQITVTGTRSAMTIADSLASQLLITRADIEKLQPVSVMEILDTLAGIDLSGQGGKGQSSSVFLRGANSNHTLVLVDGIRISSATLGATELQNIAPELIERIEIVKGPRAALWGSDAIGGVIQIFTRKLSGGEYYAGLTFGSDKFTQTSLGFGISHGNGQTSVTVNHEESNGFDVLQSAEPDDDGYQQSSVAIKGQQVINKQFSLAWLLSALAGKSDYDNAYGGTNKSQSKNHVWALSGDYLVNQDHLLSFSYGQNRDSARNYGNGTSLADAEVIETRRDQLSLVDNVTLSEQLQVNFGIDYLFEDISSDTDYTIAERDIWGAFAHVYYQVNAFDVEFASRYDDVENLDSQTTYNLGLGYRLSQDQRLVLNFGTGFKAPTFNDLYWPASLYSAGNDELVAETSKTVELTYSINFQQLNLGAALYKSAVDNLINWQADENFFYQPQNVNEATITGAELSLDYKSDNIQHQFNASYIEAEDKRTNKQLARRAKEQFNYVISADLDDWQVNMAYQFNGKRYEYLFDGSAVQLNSYQLVSLTANYALTNKLALQMKLENAFDKHYQTANNYNAPQRSLYVTIRYDNF